MDRQQLIRLRKKQMMYQAISISILTGCFFILIKMNIPWRKFCLILCLIQCISVYSFVKWKTPSLISRISKDMKELEEYEKRKLGDEWNKLQRTNLLSQIFLIALWLFQAWIRRDDGPLIPGTDFSLLDVLLLWMAVMSFVLIYQYFYNKKVDRTDDFSGFARNKIFVDIGVAILLSYIIFIALLVFVLISFTND